MVLYHDIPKSQGVANCLKRAAQLRDVRWTPKGNVSTGLVIRGEDGKSTYADSYTRPYFPLQGINYSSVRLTEKFVGFDVSLETYLSALVNPNSVMYKKNQNGTGVRIYSYYGTVCSAYVSYVTDRPFRTPCAAWPKLPDVQEISPEDLDQLELCDLVLHPQRHATIITDIQRDVEGHVRKVTISECTVPLTRQTDFTPEELRRVFLDQGFLILRYAGVHKATYTPDPFMPLEGDTIPEGKINTSLMTDFGNKANYILGTEPVEITMLEEGWERVEVTAPDGTARLYTPDENGMVFPVTEKPGFYKALALKHGKRACSSCPGQLVESEPVEWCCIDVDAEMEKTVFKVGEPLVLRFKNNLPGDDCFTYAVNSAETNYLRGQGYFTESEKESGICVLREDERLKKPGKYWGIVISHGKYSMYASRRFSFEVTEV